LDLFKKEWNIVSPNFDWDDSSTWTIENCPMMFGKGMSVFNGFGQSEFMWSLRTNPKIYQLYQKIFDTKELVVSLDGFSVFISSKQKSKSWLHIDENPENPIYSIQGAYNFLEVKDKDSGFVVVPKSHKTFKPETKNKKDWIVMDQEVFVPKAVKLLIPPNCMVLWNSRTIHANVGMNFKGLDFNRLTCYITYLPSKQRSPEIKKKRIEAYLNGKATSHWCNKCELKRYPFGYKKNYEKKGFGELIPKLVDTEIPSSIMIFI